MNCLYCESDCVKYGVYGKNIQRYKCEKCNKTFSSGTIENVNTAKNKRLALHLVLAGCSTGDIASALKIKEKAIENWINLHFRGKHTFLPSKPLLAIRTLITIYISIEKLSIPKWSLPKVSRRRVLR